jgi:hypothetical protein
MVLPLHSAGRQVFTALGRHSKRKTRMRKFALIGLIAVATPALAEDVTMDSVLGTTLTEVET